MPSAMLEIIWCLRKKKKSVAGSTLIYGNDALCPVPSSAGSHLGWAAATAENSLLHIGLPKEVFCLRPVTTSVDWSKLSAAWPT